MTAATHEPEPGHEPEPDAETTRHRLDKGFATFAARFAMRGWQLWRTDAGDPGPVRYVAARWNRVTVLADLAEVDALLRRIAGDSGKEA